MSLTWPSGLWGMWESRTIVRLFQAAVGIRQQEFRSKASHSVDFHGCVIVHRLFFFDSFFFFVQNKFPLWKSGSVALRTSHPTASTVKGDFRARLRWGTGRMLRCCPARTRL